MNSVQSAQDLLRKGDHVGALSQFLGLRDTGNASAAVYDGLGQCYYALGQHDNAMAASKQALEMDSALAMPHAIIAYVLYRLHRAEEGLSEALKAYEMFPDNPPVLDCYGTLLLAAGRKDDAIPILKHAVELNPELLSARNNLAIAYRDSNQAASYYDETRQLFQQRRSWRNARKLLDAWLARYALPLTGIVVIAMAALRGWMVGMRLIRERNWRKAMSSLISTVLFTGLLLVLYLVLSR